VAARTLADLDGRRGSASELQCAVIETEDGPIAYALYRMSFGFTRGIPTGAVHVVEALAARPMRPARSGGTLLDIDLTAGCAPGRCPSTPAVPARGRAAAASAALSGMACGCASWTLRRRSSPHVRGTRSRSSWRSPTRFCPWNTGRWRIGDDRASRTSDAPDLRCDVTALASVYLGGFTWAQLAAALCVEEMRPGALARCRRALPGRRCPVVPEIF